MSIVTEIERLQKAKQDLKIAIEAKGVEVGDALLSSYADKISMISEGGVPEKDINFYDADGTRLYSYTLSEIQELQELPPLPAREGLICQCWNWTLEEIQTEGKEVEVGAIYITDDGATRVYLEITYPHEISLTLYQSKKNGVTIDWGDGSATSKTGISTGTSYNTIYHKYEQPGQYMLSFIPDDDCLFGGMSQTWISGSQNNGYNVGKPTIKKINLGKNVGYRPNENNYYCFDFQFMYFLEEATIPNLDEYFVYGQCFIEDSCLKAVILPPNANASGFGIRGTSGLKALSFNKNCGDTLSGSCTGTGVRRFILPNCIKHLTGYTFQDTLVDKLSLPQYVETMTSQTFLANKTIEEIILPNTVTTIAINTFKEMPKLKYLQLSDLIESVETYAFNSNKSLRTIKFGKNIKSIDPSYWSNIGLQCMDFSRALQVPTLASIQTYIKYAIIKVPQDLYDEWIAATNWSSCKNIVAVERED